MSLKRLCLGLAAVLSVGPAHSQRPSAITLNELLTRTIETNRNLLAARQQIEEARGLLRQAGVRPAPTIAAGGATGRPVATAGEEQFSVTISREFETGGKRTRRQEVAEKQVAIAQSEYAEKVRQLRYEIASRYAGYAAIEEKLRILDAMAEANRRSMELTRARVEKGDAALLDQNLIATEIARTEAQRSGLIGELEAARADITRLIGLEAGEIWTAAAIAIPSQTPTLAELQKRGIEQRPDLQTFAQLEEQGAAATALAQAEGKANITASAGYGRINSRFDGQYGFTRSGEPTQLRDRDGMLTVAVAVPVFSRQRNTGNIDAAVARTKAAQLRKEYLTNAIPLEIEAAWRRLQRSRSALETLEGQAITLALRNLEVIRQAYQLGQLRSLDVLVEQRRVLDMQLAAVDIRLELDKSFFDLERAVGGPIQ